MRVLVGKLHELVFDARTIARAGSVNKPGIQRRKRNILFHERSGIRSRARNPAGKLFRSRHPPGETSSALFLVEQFLLIAGIVKSEKHGFLIAFLFFALRKVYGRSQNARRRSRFQPVDRNSGFRETVGKRLRIEISKATAVIDVAAYEHFSLQECSGGHDDCFSEKTDAEIRSDADDFSVFKNQPGGNRLKKRKIFLSFANMLHARGIHQLVALRARRLHGRTFRSIEHAKLQGGGVGAHRHFSAHGVYFPNDMTFRLSAYGGIAAHF